MLREADLTRLRAWARLRRVEQPPERCSCLWGCAACCRWLNANTVYREPDPSARRRRLTPAEPREVPGAPRVWQAAPVWLGQLPEPDELPSYPMLRRLLVEVPGVSEPSPTGRVGYHRGLIARRLT